MRPTAEPARRRIPLLARRRASGAQALWRQSPPAIPGWPPRITSYASMDPRQRISPETLSEEKKGSDIWGQSAVNQTTDGNRENLQWSVQGSNLRPPGCKPGALPAELTPLDAKYRRSLLTRTTRDVRPRLIRSAGATRAPATAPLCAGPPALALRPGKATSSAARAFWGTRP
jgi:hypothetical protein